MTQQSFLRVHFFYFCSNEILPQPYKDKSNRLPASRYFSYRLIR